MAKTKNIYPQLLPIGLGDSLPETALLEDSILRKLGDYFGSCGYERVKPPLLEFESSLPADKSFRVMDPLSTDSQLLTLRSDMTIQVARIATERLQQAVRPLRLFYSGEVLRVKGSQLRPKRQFMQVGAEIIGTNGTAHATEELLIMAWQALERTLGKKAISFDLSLPQVVGELLQANPSAKRESIASALQVRDADFLRRGNFKHGDLLADLASSAGAYPAVIKKLDKIKWTAKSKPLYARLKSVAKAVKEQNKNINLTVDIVENQGFDYQSGMSFTIYAKGLKGALGRGGEYLAGKTQEPACGFSFYMDSLLQISSALKSGKKILAMRGTSLADLESHRKGGTIVTLDWVATTRTALEKSARSRGYTHILYNKRVLAL